jgi:hypothetical protein
MNHRVVGNESVLRVPIGRVFEMREGMSVGVAGLDSGVDVVVEAGPVGGR